MNGYNDSLGIGMGYGYWFGWIIGFIILVVIIVMVIRIVKKNNLKQSGKKSPLEVLKNRYAKGEISKVEFEEKKSDIS